MSSISKDVPLKVRSGNDSISAEKFRDSYDSIILSDTVLVPGGLVNTSLSSPEPHQRQSIPKKIDLINKNLNFLSNSTELNVFSNVDTLTRRDV